MIKRDATAYAMIQRLRRALYLTSLDAEKHGFHYRPQSICVKALADSAKWLEVNRPDKVEHDGT